MTITPKIVSLLVTLMAWFPLVVVSPSAFAVDPEQEMEALDDLNVEQDTEEIASDDMRAMAKEAKKEAKIAEDERRDAEKKLVEARSQRKQVEQETNQEIERQLVRKKKNSQNS